MITCYSCPSFELLKAMRLGYKLSQIYIYNPKAFEICTFNKQMWLRGGGALNLHHGAHVLKYHVFALKN